MGTRNVTIIIKNGETKVRQYGQWNGYPTTAISALCKVLKDEEMLAALNQNVQRCKLIAEDEVMRWREADMLRNAANSFERITDYLRAQGKSHFDFSSEKEWVENICQAFPREDVQFYELQCRDTGFYIAEAIATCGFEGELLVPDCGITDVVGGIAAVNIIDLDQRMLFANWRGIHSRWSFDALPSDEKLEAYENAGE